MFMLYNVQLSVAAAVDALKCSGGVASLEAYAAPWAFHIAPLAKAMQGVVSVQDYLRD